MSSVLSVLGRYRRAARRRIVLWVRRSRMLRAGTTSVDVSPIRSDLRAVFPGAETEIRNGIRQSYEQQRLRLIDINERARSSGMRYRGMRYNRKRDAYDLARYLGVSVPHVWVAAVPAADLEESMLRDRCVIKPHDGSTNRGVHVLTREGDRWRDHMHGSLRCFGDLQESLVKGGATGRHSSMLLIEEALVPAGRLSAALPIPDDLKIFFFDDVPLVVMQRRLHSSPRPEDWRFSFCSARGLPLGPVRYAERFDASIERPDGLRDVVEAATIIARELALPQVRIDMYDTDRGPVFGEITPLPGAGHWIAEVDRLLGLAGAWAEERILARGLPLEEPRHAR